MKNDFIATQKFLLLSPRKIRPVVEVIKKMKPVDAVEKLPFVQKKGAAELAKVIKSAIASAKNKGISDRDLVFKEIQIGEGPRLKRGRAVSRGMWHPFKRRMSHIRVILTATVKAEVVKAKKEIKAVKEEKKEKNGTKS